MDSSANASVATARPGGLARLLALAALLGIAASCTPRTSEDDKPKQPVSRYPTLELRKVPAFMKGTVYECCDIANTAPYPISAYGLVVGLAGTGNNNGTPMAVRNHLIDEMVRRGFGSQDERWKAYKPELVVRDPRTAIAEVYGFLPAGARAGQRMDIFVQAVTGSQTSSLARGQLYLTELRINGVDPVYPRGGVNVYAKAMGPIFVNPTYVSADPAARSTSKSSFRSGVILNGGLINQDRPIWIRLRTPQLSLARAIEARIRHRFQDTAVARTQDEGLVYLFVPKQYRGDWEHFAGVCTHLYINSGPGAGAIKARELVQEAQTPDAPLQDISYAWEAIGEEAIEVIRPLYTSSSPDIAYAAARAGAMVADSTGEMVLLEMARTDNHPFQLNAVKALGQVAESPRITRMLTELLSSSSTLVRIEAYRVLADQGAQVISSREIRGQFVLDRVFCAGPPLVYATRSGVPRLALFGQNLSLRTPIIFSAMDGKFTISGGNDGRIVVFDRTDLNKPTGTQLRMPPDLYELLWRLGGGSDDGFAFCYSDLVGLIQALSAGQHIAANFVLQDMAAMQDDIEQAPPIVEPAGQTPTRTP